MVQSQGEIVWEKRRVKGLVFYFSDPFDDVLKHFSPEYLHQAWNKLQGFLVRHKLSGSFYWAWASPEDAYSTLKEREKVGDAPWSCWGWGTVSKKMLTLSDEEKFTKKILGELKFTSPRLTVVKEEVPGWRVLKRSPRDFNFGLQHARAACLEDRSLWVANQVEKSLRKPGKPWRNLVHGYTGDAAATLGEAWKNAEKHYSPWSVELLREVERRFWLHQ